MKRIILFLLSITLSTAVLAGNNDREKTRTKIVTGKITASTGEALPGASIVIAETGETFYADMEGHFKVTFASDQDLHLTIHNIGFVPKQIESRKLSAFTDLSLEEL